MRRFFVVVTLAALASGQRADAQQQELDRSPRFLLASDSRLVPVDVRATPLLGQRLSLALNGATVKEALAEIVRQSGLRLVYSDDVLPARARVRLHAEGITVVAALTDVLFDAGLDVVFSPNGRAALVRRGTLFQTGTVTGRVTDSASGQAVVGVGVFLNRTRWRAMTDADGRYRMADVTPGPYTLAARRIGYRVFTQPVTVEADQEAIVDVTLRAAPSELEAVVVTATGERRLLELGHVVGRINADSLVKEAPVTTLTELLTARVPGLQVFQTQGTVGGRVNLLVRGPNSFGLTNQPIFIIDGVRYTTDERTPLCSGACPGSTEPTSPLNDLNPNDIESVEVVKGPSAATLYGTDAANGVVVITTKRGRAGPPRWNAYASGTTTNIPTGRMRDIWWGWGTVNGIPNNPNLSCTLERKESGSCTQQDSVTLLRIAHKDPQFSIFAPKPTYQYGLNVSGGAADLQYYFSADFTDATGAIRMPPAFVDDLKARLGLSELPPEWREPNSAGNLNLRSNVSAVLGQTLDLRLNTGYVHSSTNALTVAGFGYDGPLMWVTPANPYPLASFGRSPETAFARWSTDDVDRFVGTFNGDWRPLRWLSARARLGLDLLGSRKHALARQGDQPANRVLSSGSVEETRTRQLSLTADLGASATARRGRLSARTAVGAQYTRTLLDAVGVFGTGLAPGQTAVPGATLVQDFYNYRESVVLGGYVEQMLGLNDRLFVTGAVRVDGASAFGRAYQAAAYPKLGASWLVTSERFMPRIPGLDELRLRFALGASGAQADAAWARPGFSLQSGVIDSQTVQLYLPTALGNPDLRPERTRESELGFDASAFAGRLNLEVTRFARRTTDQIVFVPLPSGLGSIYDNLGLTTQSGFEATINARVLDTRVVSLDLRYQHSYYTTKLVDLGRGLVTCSGNDQWGCYREGYPLGARFYQPISGWQDSNGDGVLSFNEIQFDTLTYAGESFPPRTQALSPVLGLFEGRVRISALLERQSGFTQIDPYACPRSSIVAACRELVDWNTPVEVQARMLLAATPQPAGFTRLREVTVALDLPPHVTRVARLQRATLVVSGRNLALWSKFTGADPEVHDPNHVSVGAFGISGGGAASGIPLGRSYSVRLDLGF
ncbi:MAG TPA: TonB-dependent receptor [Methylomirabilota bacterium]|jgi:TonB-linked SusC/RagA family outer membrane protein|nr:TonB-dependent receptor [Methylomirabilota bacterium]